MSASSATNPQRRKTEAYYQREVAPLIQDFVGACLRHRPDDVAQFACHYFGSEARVDGGRRGLSGLSRDDYEICFLKPAKQAILEPLVHRLLHSMPADPLRFLRRQFSMFAVIIKEFGKGVSTSLDRDELRAFLDSIGLHKNETELEAIVQQVDANKDGVIDLAEFAIRIPFDVSDAVVLALRKADRKLQVAKHMATYFNCESPTDLVAAADVLSMLESIGLLESRRFASLIAFLKAAMRRAGGGGDGGSGGDHLAEAPISEYVARLKDKATQELLDRALNEAIAVRQMRWQVDIRDQITQYFDTDRTGHLLKSELVYLLHELSFFSRAVNRVIDNLGGVGGGVHGGARPDDLVVDLQQFAAAVPAAAQRQLLVAIANNKNARHHHAR